MVTGCSWMVIGDYIGVLGSRFGAPAILVTGFGIGYVLLGDSTFAATFTKRLPRRRGSCSSSATWRSR
jgi:hypothetical protein